MIALTITPIFAAAGYSLIYLLGGGGLFGAVVIFFVAKMFGKRVVHDFNPTKNCPLIQ